MKSGNQLTEYDDLAEQTILQGLDSVCSREVEIYKISWNKKNIGLYWLLADILGIVLLFVGSMANIQIIAWVGSIAVTAAQVMQIMRCFRQSKVFGRGGGMTWALILVNPIANFVLGRSLSEYKGFTEE